MKKNHWGVWVDSNTPITGVLSIRDVAWEWIDDEICLDCEAAIADIEKRRQWDIDDCMEYEEEDVLEYWDNELEMIECDSSHTKLLGDWLQDKQGKYYPDPAGEFAAIENENTVQVVFSIHTVRGLLCSPCYPGQADISSDSKADDYGYLAYTLPAELLRGGEDVQ